MLRPERMSKVSVTGARSIMPTVIDTVHDLTLVHLSDYDGSWEGFENGNPIEGAEDASERLVTIRSLENTLGLSPADEHVSIDIDEDTLDERLATAREDITDVEDRLVAAREKRRSLGEQIDRYTPYAALGLDLELYTGYDSIAVAVGRGDGQAIDEALDTADEVRAYDLETADDVIAVFAAPAAGVEHPIDDALVGIEYTRIELPDDAGIPAQRIEALRAERRRVQSDIDSLEAELEGLKHEHGSFLRSAERKLSIVVDQAEAPLRFATTERAFVAEGWIPANRYDDLVTALRDAVGDRVEVEELLRADYAGHVHPHEEASEPTEAAATDGGHDVTDDEPLTMDEEPPVVLDNPSLAGPFELLTNTVNRPKYSEIDPTMAVVLTFPIAFGFMIGDVGYGLLYILMGWFLLRYDSRGMRAIGTIGIWCGVFTMLFGWLYDDTFGIHIHYFDAEIVHYFELLGLGFLDKGIQSPDWLMTWILASLFFGWLHLNIGLVIRVFNELAHGWKAAFFEAGSWLIAMNGFIIWLFSHSDATRPIPNIDLGVDMTAGAAKPEVFFGPESVIAHTGFEGFPEFMGLLGLVALFVGLVLVGVGEGIAGLVESPAWVMGHFLSYLRIVAVLLGKGAMAFVVNLIVFGAYVADDGYVVQNYPGSTAEFAAHGTVETSFAGLWNIDPLVIPIAILIFVLGHFIVLILGITAAGIQMLRLEYVEFFQKFFEGGGRPYEAFGADPQPDG